MLIHKDTNNLSICRLTGFSLALSSQSFLVMTNNSNINSKTINDLLLNYETI